MIHVLAVLTEDKIERYKNNIDKTDQLNIRFVTDQHTAIQQAAAEHVDVVVIDVELGNEDNFVLFVRQRYPRLLIVLVDEGADFGFPGQADAISTDPLNENQLVKRILQTVNDRREETLHGERLPAIRDVSNLLHSAPDLSAKAQTAVDAIQAQGYDYVAFYHLGVDLSLKAQAGPPAINAIAPETAEPEDLMSWVVQTQRSQIAAPDDRPTHPLVSRGRLGAVVCVPVSFNNQKHGVIAVCNDRPSSISQDSVMILELIATQLASALGKSITS